MTEIPLIPSNDSQLLSLFIDRFAMSKTVEPREMLRAVAMAFTRLPYENFTKIIKPHELGSAERSRRGPDKVLTDRFKLSKDGTCFSLTATLLHLVRSPGFRAEPILAERRYGADTHSALLVWLDGQPHLLGLCYLIVDPIPLDAQAEKQYTTPFSELLLRRRVPAVRLDLPRLLRRTVWQRATRNRPPIFATIALPRLTPVCSGCRWACGK